MIAIIPETANPIVYHVFKINKLNIDDGQKQSYSESATVATTALSINISQLSKFTICVQKKAISQLTGQEMNIFPKNRREVNNI